ncbi:MAG: hypothetical protein V7763_12880 [Sulfitobacter sp.]|jgi:hypothetical protein|uniref:hypothetical protein n=1 Tax=Sulfitobacter sp. TaxID=1903071 RepID=UPI003B5F0CEE
MKRLAALLSLLTLAACGADGEPQPPKVHSSVTLSNSGVSVGTGVSMGRGALRVGVAGWTL